MLKQLASRIPVLGVCIGIFDCETGNSPLRTQSECVLFQLVYPSFISRCPLAASQLLAVSCLQHATEWSRNAPKILLLVHLLWRFASVHFCAHSLMKAFKPQIPELQKLYEAEIHQFCDNTSAHLLRP